MRTPPNLTIESGSPTAPVLRLVDLMLLLPALRRSL